VIRWQRGDLEVTVLSSHGGVSIAVLLRQADRFLLVDAGDGASRDLASRRVPVDALEGIVVTHDHGDHAAGLPALLWWLRLGRRAAPLPVLLPADSPLARGGVALFLDALGERARVSVDSRTLAADRVERLGPFTVTPFPVPHRRSHSDPPGLLMEAYGLTVEAGGARVVVSGDTGPSTRLEREVTGADLALLEAAAGERPEPLADTHLNRSEAERIGHLAREFRLYHGHSLQQ
jgi:ribonuclease BN (tRNA processing enzyme)